MCVDWQAHAFDCLLIRTESISRLLRAIVGVVWGCWRVNGTRESFMARSDSEGKKLVFLEMNYIPWGVWSNKSTSNIVPPRVADGMRVDDPIGWSCSCIKASSVPAPSKVPEEDLCVWRDKQNTMGRFIISDSHFRVGGFVRSVPRLGNPCLGQLMKSRAKAQEINRYRGELGLPPITPHEL